MFRFKRWTMILSMATVALAYRAAAQDYQLKLITMDAGGGSGAGADIALDCTVGQTVAGTSVGGDYVMSSGYWGGATHISAPGDCNGNGVVELADFSCFVNCFTGADGIATPECLVFDLDSDGDVDGTDYAAFFSQFGS